MPTLEEVKEQIAGISGTAKLLGRREIKELPQILWDDERVVKVIQGLYGSRNGLLVATQRRMIFVDKGMMGSLKVEEFVYDKVSSLQYETGMIFGKMTIFASGNRAEIKQVQKESVRPFADAVQALLARKSEVPTASVPAVSAAPGTDVLSQLERLGNLRTQGILTEEEFQAQKQKLLA